MAIIPAYTINGFTRPALHTDTAGNIILDPVAASFAATYGIKALYLGVPASTPYPPVAASLTSPSDTNNTANSVAEGAANGTAVGLTALATNTSGQPVTYTLTDNAGGRFAINSTTGVVTVANGSLIDFENNPSHSYSITVQANDGILTTSRSFAIGVSDVAPSAPSDVNGAANTVAEGAANGTTVGVTLAATDVNGGAITYSLTDDANGAFAINSTTGVITVADSTKIDYETAVGHAYTVTAQASDGTLANSQTFTIAVSDVAPPAPSDTNGATNTIAEGAANGSTVGITASSVDPNGPATTYSLTDSAGGRFAINSATGVVTVANGAAIDFETAVGHAYGITVQATNGALSTSSAFSIGVTDVGPSAPTDTNGAANTVFEGTANGTVVGITASATDPGGGPAPTYSLTDSAGGRFAIDANTGIVTVANGVAIDFETAAGHAYGITVQTQAGALTSTKNFSIGVSDVAPSTPLDANGGANTVAEGAAIGTTVGVTVSATDVNGGAITYSLTDNANGAFAVNSATGVITVADPTKIDYETAPGHAYAVTAQASDGTLSRSQTFTIAVSDVAPSTPVDSNAAANVVVEGAANGTTVGITASATDLNGPVVTYSLIGDTSGGGFTIDSTTGVVTVADATKIDYESAAGHAYTVTAQASDGTLTSSQAFSVIAVTDEAPSTPVDSNGAADTVDEGAANGSTVGVTAFSTDVNGPAVTYSLNGDTSGGGFTINAATGVVTVADATKIDFESSGGSYTVTAQASDGTLSSSQIFTIAVSDVEPSTPVDSDGGTDTVAEGAANGSTVGVTASSTDVNGPAVTYSLIGDTSGGAFTIDSSTGVVTVADATKIDYETAAGHAYTVTAQASHGTLSSSQTFTIAVTDVAPSTPVDIDGATNTIVEGAANGSTVGVTASSTDVNGPAATWALVGDTSGGGFTINAATGVVTIADASKIDFESSGGSYTVTAQASDGTLTSSQDFVIDVSDFAPSSPIDSDATANSVVQSAAVGTYTGLTASSIDVNGPGVTYTLVGDTSSGGFTVNSATGAVTVADSSKIIYSGAPTTYDVIVDVSDGTLHNQQTFSINVDPNAPPAIDSNGSGATAAVSVAENQTAVTTVTATDPDAGPSLITYSIVPGDDGAKFSIVASGAGAGTLTFLSAPDFENPTDTADTAGNNTYVVTVRAFDGAAFDDQTITVTVTGVNELPQAVADTGTITEDAAPTLFAVVVNNDVLDPDAGALNSIAISGTVTASSAGDPNISNGDATATVIGNQIQVALGADFQSLAQGETATVAVPYTLTGNSPGDTSSSTLTVTVTGVNDGVTAIDDAGGSITEDAGLTTYNVRANDTLDVDHTALNTVTIDSVSATDTSGDGITGGDVTASVTAGNQIQFTLGSDFQKLGGGESSTITIGYTLHGDQGGDTDSATLTYTVTGVNDAPVAQDFTFNGTNSGIGNTSLVLDNGSGATPVDPAGPQKTISGNLLSGATDVDTAASSFTITAGSDSNAAGTITYTMGGDFTYTPAAGFTGNAVFNYTLNDNDASGNATDTGQVTINVAAPKVWYVDDSAAAGGDGTSDNPFNSLAALNGVNGVGDVDGANDTIFLYNGTYSGGIALENGQTLISQSQGLTVNGTALEAASGGNALINGGVVLATGNTVDGIDFGNVAGFSLSGSSVGTATVAHSSINNASGGGVSIGGSSNVLNMDFTSLSTTGGTGITLTNSSGTFHSHSGTISNASGVAVLLNGGTLDFTQDGAISNSGGSSVSITNMSGGDQDFNGAITGSNGIVLAGNTGATMSFDGGMTLSTGTGNAFSATGGGTVTVTGTNHLTTTTGTALNISNTTIGSADVTFQDISANGATNGIVLNNTGSAGGLTVTGTGSGTVTSAANATGGAIQNSTGTGISLTNVGGGVSLTRMFVGNNGDDGIFGSSVTNFTLLNSLITGNGNAANTDHGLDFTNLLGTGTITNTTFSNNEVDQVRINNSTGTASVTFDNVSVSSTGLASAPNGQHGISFNTHSTANADLVIKNSAFNNLFSNSIDTGNDGTGVLEVTINNDTFNNVGASAINIVQQNPDAGGAGTVRFNIHDNGTAAAPTFLRGTNTGASHSININQADNNNHSTGGVLEGVIENNFIGDNSSSHSANSGGDGISVFSNAPGTTTVKIDGNVIKGVGSNGINVQMSEDSNAAHTLNATIFNNSATVTDINSFDGIRVVAGALAGDAGTFRLDMHDNTASSATGNDFTVAARFNTTMQLLGYGGGALDTAAVQAYLDVTKNNNPAGPGADWFVFTQGAGVFANTASVPQPTLPSPLLAAPGGVQALSPTPGETHLTQAQLDSVVGAAITQWAHAGASAAQLAALAAITFSVADLAGNVAGDHTPGHIVIDTDAAGHGWFVDPTPNDNSEFTHAQNAAGTDLFTDPSNAAAGHLDLLTTVAHEMGHELGLPDLTAVADVNDLMYINLVDGERRLVDAGDVPVIDGTPGNDTIDAGHGGQILAGGAGADNFVFANVEIHATTPWSLISALFGAPPVTPPALTHVADYSFAQGDSFDFSALTSAFHGSWASDAQIVRAVEDPSGTFATLQVNANAPGGIGSWLSMLLQGNTKSTASWVDVAQLDGAHAGDDVSVLIDSHAAVHVAHLHVGLLV